MEHSGLGALSYAGGYYAGKQRWASGVVTVSGVAVAKELLGDWHNGKDTFPEALLHVAEILGGGGGVAIAKH